jgi:transposase
MNGPAFLAYIEQFLAPQLVPGDIVICDNLASHKVSGVAQAIEARGARLLYLPAYSPDLNPIEMAFSKLKAHVRHAAQRTFAGLETAVAQALDTFLPVHCANFLRHANYATN